MRVFSTSEAAQKLGIHRITLQRYATTGKITAPKVTKVGPVAVRLWTAKDIERVRKEMQSKRKGSHHD